MEQLENKWISFRECPSCNKKIKYQSDKKYITARSLRNTEIKKSCCHSCIMSGKNNPFFNKCHSKESKKQISKSRTGKAMGSENSMANPEHRKKAATNLKKAYDSGSLDFLKEIQRQGAIQKQADGRFKIAPISKAEIEIRKILELKFTVEPQFKIGSLRYDLFLKEINLLIEYNGDYWHCNPEVYSANYFHEKKQLTAQQIWDNDKNKRKLAEDNGYKVFTIWEKDFKINRIEILKNILNGKRK